MRLNVFLQRAGVCSRREAERLVEQGRVSVNGSVAAATVPVNDGDRVTVDGKTIEIATHDVPRLFLLNKPVGVLVTHRDPRGRKTVFDLPALQPPLWSADMPRVTTVGRLDVNSEGLLVLSSDGALAQAMMKPASALPRLYRARVKGWLKEKDIMALKRGVTIDGTRYRSAEIEEEPGSKTRSNTWYRVTLFEGKNREIRKIFAHFGCMVNRLIRIQYGPFELGSLKPGELREVPEVQVRRLQTALFKLAQQPLGPKR